jgi:hypothetical protein
MAGFFNYVSVQPSVSRTEKAIISLPAINRWAIVIRPLRGPQAGLYPKSIQFVLDLS